ncbi:ubiquinol-cytochrome c reductase complex 14 kDa protein [Wilcoxina mikolae CBS 423.85]|nr:ubiquinol-cytochrome c reductase complex 14 kDa protein [Wilcoxina mikolae CBS 423.85]
MAAIAKRIAEYTKSRPGLYKVMRPLADKYLDLAGYRKVGLVYDDLIAEENDVVQKALKRLPPRLVYDRMFRQRRAMQCSLAHQILPLEEQTKPEEDIHYLRPYIEEVQREFAERKEFDAMVKSQ